MKKQNKRKHKMPKKNVEHIQVYVVVVMDQYPLTTEFWPGLPVDNT